MDVENGGMATHLVPNWGDLGSVGVPAPARTPLGPLGPKMGPHFPAKSAEILELSSIFGLPGILHRIQQIQRIHRKRDTASRTDPGFPTPGSRMTVVYTNSLKLVLSAVSTENKRVRRAAREIWFDSGSIA